MSKMPFNPDQLDEKRWEWFEAHLTPKLKNRLYFEAFMILHNQQDAEDALGSALLQGILKLHQLKTEDNFYSWMTKILVREACHIKTKRTRHMLLSYEFYRAEHDRPVNTPEERVIDRERKDQLLRAIEQLKSPEKEIVTLKNWQGMSLLEISKKLGLNYHTTRSKYTRALHSLMSMLKNEGGDDKHEKK